ncbi:MAG TPA: FAD-dependent oxidoreductase, partial [Jiangellaceae bacterium]
AMGSAAAWQLARRGADVVLLEQFGLGHARGSSHGSSRIVRLSYEDPFYVELAAAAYERWDELEADAGVQLLTWTGVVDHGDRATVEAMAEVLRQQGHSTELVAPAAAADRWPGLRLEPPILFHPRGGQVHADQTVAALKRVAAQLGADIRHDTQVTAIVPTPDGVEIRTADETLWAPMAVVAAGAWTAPLLAGLVVLPRLTVTREQPAHFPPRDRGTPWPSFIHHLAGIATRGTATPRGAYGLSSADGLKVGFHAVGPVVDPSRVSIDVDQRRLRQLQDYVDEWVPGVDADRPDAVPCLYTLTDNTDFVIDRVGPLAIAAGFSGHGFKFTPQIGHIVADLVLDTGLAPRRFRLNRP